jgi:hypothetical protein
MIPLRLSATALRWVFIWTILLSSFTTLIQALGMAGKGANLGLAALASVEIAAIAAFATERWRGWAALVLILVFATAFVASAVEGEFAGRFVYFAASAVFFQSVDRHKSQEQRFG